MLLIGGIVAGWSSGWRLPWPYAAGEGPRSVEAEGVAAATWNRDELGQNHRIGADDQNRQLLGAVGDQWTMSTISGGINPNWVIAASELDADRVALLRSGRVEYLLVDRRLVTRPDLFDGYFEDPDLVQAVRKFDSIAGVSRVYDSGNIVIYDVRALSGAS